MRQPVWQYPRVRPLRIIVHMHFLALMIGTASASAGSARRISLSGEWGMQTPGGAARPVVVPVSIEPVGGVTTYRKAFTVPPGTCNDLVRLQFDGVSGQAAVELNGVPLGQHGSYTPFGFDVTGPLHHDEPNELVVTIDDRYDVTTVPHDDAPWLNYSGIIRDVALECATGALLLSCELQYDLTPDFSHVAAEVSVRAATSSNTGVEFAAALLDGAPGNWMTVAVAPAMAAPPAGSDGRTAATLSFAFDNPDLWSPDRPKLYDLYVAALVDGVPRDEKIIRVGFREVRVEGPHILLNGKPLFLKGVCRHDLYPGTGFVGSEQQMRDDMLAIKSTGANYVRLIHYPHNPRILDLADELGLVVSAEPGWGHYWHPDVQQTLLTMLDEMIRRDVNHPSIFLWVTGNARGYFTDYAAAAQALVRARDRNRLATFAIDNDEYDPETIAADMAFLRNADLDVYMKLTMWFYYAEYLQDAWVNFPKDVPIVVSEFGREGDDRFPVAVVGDQPFWWGEDQQADAVSRMLEAWRPHLPPYNASEFISGLTYFDWQDFDWPGLVEYLPTHVPSLHLGLVYEDRVRKQVFGVLAGFYTTLPTAFVGLPTVDDAIVERRFAWPASLPVPLNAPYRDAAPSISADGRTLYFASDGPDHVGAIEIRQAEYEHGAWSTPSLVDLPPDPQPDAFRDTPCIAAGGDELYFSRGLIEGIYITHRRIQRSRRVDGHWTQPEDLGDVVNDPDPARVTTDPALTADGQRLYFSSDRPGGMGRTDLWVTERVGATWAVPVNLGSAINTPFNETGPSISRDGKTLYFASDRPGGLGSDDIWVSHYLNGLWSDAKNLGPELNSTGSDLAPELAPDGRSLYFTGIRAGGNGLSDIWVSVATCNSLDLDGDRVIDLQDLSYFLDCVTTPLETSATDACLEGDADHDGDVDLLDYARLQACFGGC